MKKTKKKKENGLCLKKKKQALKIRRLDDWDIGNDNGLVPNSY